MNFLFKNLEDPDTWCSKHSGNVPVLLVEKSKCYLIVGKVIMAEMETDKLNELALLASFYLLDLDYHCFRELGLNIFQCYIPKECHVPQDISGPFQMALIA